MCQLATSAAALAVPWSLKSIAAGQAAARLLQLQVQQLMVGGWQGEWLQQRIGQGCGAGRRQLTGVRTKLAT
jgi:hypothetical protein